MKFKKEKEFNTREEETFSSKFNSWLFADLDSLKKDSKKIDKMKQQKEIISRYNKDNWDCFWAGLGIGLGIGFLLGVLKLLIW